MRLEEYKHIYFLGIGGIGMSALARWFYIQGFVVGGYDKTSTSLTTELINEGINIHFDDVVGQIPDIFLDKDSTLIILTPAIPKDNPEWLYFINNNFEISKRSKILGLITEDHITVAVGGTHGKTTTSSMIAHILKHAGVNVNAFLGGITVNYQSNLLTGDRNDIYVVEADEYDRSFLTLHPDIAIVTSMDADHLDVYGDHQELIKAFNEFINQIKIKGHLIVKKGLPYQLDFKKLIYVHEYGLDTPTLCATNIRIEDGSFVFDYKAVKTGISDIKLQINGFHNVENAVAAINACVLLGLEQEKIKQGLETFLGVKRRFEYIIKNDDVVFIDDYAHHPSEIEAFLKSVKKLYPNRKLTCIYQPHLFSRTSDFRQEFADSLNTADELILMDIYPARELPMDGVTSEIIFDKVVTKNKTLVTKATLLDAVNRISPEVIVTVGAGDIDTFVQPIKELLLRI